MIQLIAVQDIGSCIWCAPTPAGEVLWVSSEQAARHLIENGLCKLPSETKPAGPALRKSSGEATLHRSIVSPSLIAHGKVRLSCASAAVLVSPKRI